MKLHRAWILVIASLATVATAAVSAVRASKLADLDERLDALAVRTEVLPTRASDVIAVERVANVVAKLGALDDELADLESMFESCGAPWIGNLEDGTVDERLLARFDPLLDRMIDVVESSDARALLECGAIAGIDCPRLGVARFWTDLLCSRASVDANCRDDADGALRALAAAFDLARLRDDGSEYSMAVTNASNGIALCALRAMSCRFGVDASALRAAIEPRLVAARNGLDLRRCARIEARRFASEVRNVDATDSLGYLRGDLAEFERRIDALETGLEGKPRTARLDAGASSPEFFLPLGMARDIGANATLQLELARSALELADEHQRAGSWPKSVASSSDAAMHYSLGDRTVALALASPTGWKTRDWIWSK